MSTYLDIAKNVLRANRRPMSAKSILNAAYDAGVVPSHLYGKSQHKTLQARLSEDILHHRETSAFYRTEPGQFALVEFLEDPNIAEEWKKKFPARRRTRDLKKHNALGVKRSIALDFHNSAASFGNFFSQTVADDAVVSMHPDLMEDRGYCSMWTFSVVHKDNKVLAYRVGQYRDDRDAFANKRSIGFPGALSADDLSLFSEDSFGAEECAISVLQQDLDLSLAAFDASDSQRPKIDCVTAVSGLGGNLELVFVLLWNCPKWFEPVTRRLSLNNPEWLHLEARHNNIEDFEPWSAQVLERLTEATGRANIGNSQDYHSTISVSEVRARE